MLVAVSLGGCAAVPCSPAGPVARANALSQAELAEVYTRVAALAPGMYCRNRSYHSDCLDLPPWFERLRAQRINRYPGYGFVVTGGCFFNTVGLAVNVSEAPDYGEASIRLNPGSTERVTYLWRR